MAKPKIAAFLRTIAKPFQEIEDAFQQLRVGRRIDTAVGAQLDHIGVIVDQPRNGLTDEDYRRYLYARIATNKSNGTIPELIKIARLVLGDGPSIVIDESSRGVVVMRIRNVPLSDALRDILMSFMTDAVSAAVRIIIESSSAAQGTTFKWDTPGRGWDSGSPFVDAKDNT